MGSSAYQEYDAISKIQQFTTEHRSTSGNLSTETLKEETHWKILPQNEDDNQKQIKMEALWGSSGCHDPDAINNIKNLSGDWRSKSRKLSIEF